MSGLHLDLTSFDHFSKNKTPAEQSKSRYKFQRAASPTEDGPQPHPHLFPQKPLITEQGLAHDDDCPRCVSATHRPPQWS